MHSLFSLKRHSLIYPPTAVSWQKYSWPSPNLPLRLLCSLCSRKVHTLVEFFGQPKIPRLIRRLKVFNGHIWNNQTSKICFRVYTEINVILCDRRKSSNFVFEVFSSNTNSIRYFCTTHFIDVIMSALYRHFLIHHQVQHSLQIWICSCYEVLVPILTTFDLW